MKSEDRVKGYKKGTESWQFEYDMLLDDGVTCEDCLNLERCCTLFGQTPYVNSGKCQFYPNLFSPNTNKKQSKILEKNSADIWRKKFEDDNKEFIEANKIIRDLKEKYPFTVKGLLHWDHTRDKELCCAKCKDIRRGTDLSIRCAYFKRLGLSEQETQTIECGICEAFCKPAPAPAPASASVPDDDPVRPQSQKF
jgi:hypothetical protein